MAFKGQIFHNFGKNRKKEYCGKYILYFFLFRFCSWHHSWLGHKKLWYWTAPRRHIYFGFNIWNYRKITNIREFSEFLVFVTLLFCSELRASGPYSGSGHKMKPRSVIQKINFIFHIWRLDPKILLWGVFYRKKNP